jgi:hypothetical protein
MHIVLAVTVHIALQNLQHLYLTLRHIYLDLAKVAARLRFARALISFRHYLPLHMMDAGFPNFSYIQAKVINVSFRCLETSSRSSNQRGLLSYFSGPDCQPAHQRWNDPLSRRN